MLNRIKFRILLYLLRDICFLSRNCDICACDATTAEASDCHQRGVITQAGKVWVLEESKEDQE